MAPEDPGSNAQPVVEARHVTAEPHDLPTPEQTEPDQGDDTVHEVHDERLAEQDRADHRDLAE